MKTAGELRELIADLPDHMPVDFAPITMAWLGSTYPIYARAIHIYSQDGWEASDSLDPTAKCTVYLYEESE